MLRTTDKKRRKEAIELFKREYRLFFLEWSVVNHLFLSILCFHCGHEQWVSGVCHSVHWVQGPLAFCICITSFYLSLVLALTKSSFCLKILIFGLLLFCELLLDLFHTCSSVLWYSHCSASKLLWLCWRICASVVVPSGSSSKEKVLAPSFHSYLPSDFLLTWMLLFYACKFSHVWSSNCHFFLATICVWVPGRPHRWWWL